MRQIVSTRFKITKITVFIQNTTHQFASIRQVLSLKLRLCNDTDAQDQRPQMLRLLSKYVILPPSFIIKYNNLQIFIARSGDITIQSNNLTVRNNDKPECS